MDKALSPFKNLMVRNATTFKREIAADVERDYIYPTWVLYLRQIIIFNIYELIRFTEYPNFGLGALANGVIEWKKRHLLLTKIKAYQRVSQDFRHVVPFSKLLHAALTFPFAKVKSFFAGESGLSTKFLQK